MTDTEIFEWLRCVASAAKYSLEDGEPIYLERAIVSIEHELRELAKKEQNHD